MNEIIVNLHNHSRFSDGTGTHEEILKAALHSEIDVVITTDHNVLVQGVECYATDKQRRVLLLVGEEIHDQARDPQKNHLLVLDANRELATYAPNPQLLIDQVRMAGGLCFLAHPNEEALKMFGEDDLSWVSWEVNGFTGMELWNGMSEFKSVVHNKLEAAFYAFFPAFIPHGPHPKTLSKWDELLASGRKIVAVGGADSHQLHKSLGPIRLKVFPYAYHFQCINTHLLTPEALTGELPTDRRMVYDALREGHCFIGNDLPASTKGFRFSAQTNANTAGIGDEIEIENGVTLKIKLPLKAECHLLKDGAVIKKWTNRDILTFITTQPGVYRVECYINYLGRKIAWIISNPIYLRGKA